jgi:hypothetical protein
MSCLVVTHHAAERYRQRRGGRGTLDEARARICQMLDGKAMGPLHVDRNGAVRKVRSNGFVFVLDAAGYTVITFYKTNRQRQRVPRNRQVEPDWQDA